MNHFIEVANQYAAMPSCQPRERVLCVTSWGDSMNGTQFPLAPTQPRCGVAHGEPCASVYFQMECMVADG